MFWTSFENFEIHTQIDKNPCTIVQGLNGFSATFFKISAYISNETWASDETIHNYSGVHKECFGQVSKIPKIAPKFDKNPCTIVQGFN